MRLCDTDIEKYLDDGIIVISPRPDNSKINGATIDLRLGNSFRVFTLGHSGTWPTLDHF